jgi:transposase
MSRFKPYCPEQAYLLPPSVKDVLGEGHLCFFVQKMVARLDLSEFEAAYGDEGGELYTPAMMLSVWLYAYAIGLTAARELERRLREDLALRYLAGGAEPKDWSLSAFRRRHKKGLNTAFTQVLEFVRELGLAKLGIIAVDSSRIKAHNSKSRVDSRERLRKERAKLRRQIRAWQKQCDAEQNAIPASLAAAELEQLQQKLAAMPSRLQELKKSGEKRLPRTDGEARVLTKCRQSVVGYTADLAVSEDQFIVGQRVTQANTDNASLQPMVNEVRQNCGGNPAKVTADAGFYSNANVRAMEEQKIQAYIPDSNLAAALNKGKRVKGRARAPEMKRMRAKLRAAEGRSLYGKRKGIVEGVFGVLKSERDLHRFRLRGLAKVGIEFTLAALAYNLTRLQAEQDPNSALWQRRRCRDRKSK